MFSIVADPWVKSCFLASSLLLRVHVLLYMMIINLSSSVMLCGSTSSGCEERVVKVPVTAGQAVHTDQADFFSLSRKLDALSHRLSHETSSLPLTSQLAGYLQSQLTGVWQKWMSWKWPIDMMTISASTVRIATFFIPGYAQWATCRSIRVSGSSSVYGWRLSMSPNS